MKRLLAAMIVVLALTAAVGNAAAEGEQIWSLTTEDGTPLTTLAVQPEAGDSYVSGDNKLYEIVSVTGNTAVARYKEDFALPDVSWLDAEAALPVSAMGGERLLAFYCTHSDESYKPSDGTYSDEKRGSIYGVAHALAEAAENQGTKTVVSDNLHYPHDAGAYKRSRQTAVQLLKQTPDAIFDIHRDGIPDADEYAVTIGTKKASKVRLLVGRSNQNMAANKEFAALIKAVGDKVYPGLIKDIYMGKGTYNQDLLPRSVLLECGTYTLSKDRVLTSMPMMADVLNRAIYGGVIGSAGVSDVRGNASSAKTGAAEDTQNAAVNDDKGAGSGIWWIVGLFVVGAIVYAVVATGSAGGAWHKLKRNASEMTGGLVGEKPDKRDGTGQK